MGKPDDTSLPAYGFEDLLRIAGLASQPMLKQDRRQVAEGQDPAGQYWSGHAWVLLYRAADAVDMPPLSAGRQRLYDKARTCAMCGARRKDTYAKGRDGERYCPTCQVAAAERLWRRERAADRPAIIAWARGVLGDPTVVLAAQEYHQLWKTDLVVDLDGTVLLDAEIRHNVGEPYEGHPQADDLRRRSPLAVIDQIEALRGHRMIAWWTTAAPQLVTSFDENGWPAAHATKVARGDSLGDWYNRWVGDLAENGSYLTQHPALKQHHPPRDPHACVARMRELLTEMASGRPPVDSAPTRCCDLHNQHCEPPGDLCCHDCPEAAHPNHPAGVACTWAPRRATEGGGA